MIQTLRILFVEDKDKFPASISLRIQNDLDELEVELDIEILPTGEFVWETVRDWQPHIIMMDHNLENVKINGANLIIEIRFHNNDTPIIFYSSEMDERLMNLVAKHNEIYPSQREDAHIELLKQINIIVTVNS